MSARSRFTIVQPEGNVSWHVGVRTSDGRFRTIGKRMRDRKDKTKKRRAWTLTQLESSELPAAGPSDDEEAWETLIDGVHDRWTKEENVSRKMDKAREYCKRWNGKVPITDLSRDGYADLGVLSGIQKKDLSTLRRCILASTARSHTHGGAVKETPTTSIFLQEPGEKVEQWMEEERATTVQGEELGALRRIKAALKAAVGKEGMDRTITEGLVAKLGREGRPAQTAYPERHGDFLQPHEIPDEWSEEEKGEAAENSFTTPVLAVMLVLSPGGAAQTLFPSLSKKFTQSMGEQLAKRHRAPPSAHAAQPWAPGQGGCQHQRLRPPRVHGSLLQSRRAIPGRPSVTRARSRRGASVLRTHAPAAALHARRSTPKGVSRRNFACSSSPARWRRCSDGGTPRTSGPPGCGIGRPPPPPPA